jgi:hypothetical protein
MNYFARFEYMLQRKRKTGWATNAQPGHKLLGHETAGHDLTGVHTPWETMGGDDEAAP